LIERVLVLITHLPKGNKMHQTNENWLPRLLLSIVYTLGILGIVASGGGGGGDDDVTLNFPTPTLPAGAVVLAHPANAEDVAEDAVETLALLNLFGDLLELKTGAPPAIAHVIRQTTNQFYKRDPNTPSVATGVREDVSADFCTGPGGGSAIANVSETATSARVRVDFTDCDIGGIAVVNGDISLSATWNETTLDYTLRIGGTLVVSDGINPDVTFVFDIDTSGNDGTGAFSSTASFSVDGGPNGSYLVTTTTPIEGDFNSGDYTPGGILIVEGGNNTRLRITIIAGNFATVELDDGLGGGFLNVGIPNIMLPPL